jgi:hypothetical protein
MPDPPRRYPTPWHADKLPGGYVVRDANGQALASLYSRENEAEARQANVRTPDEARRIAVSIARLPEPLGRRNGSRSRRQPSEGRGWVLESGTSRTPASPKKTHGRPRRRMARCQVKVTVTLTT